MNGLESLCKKVAQCRYNAVSVAVCVSSDQNSKFYVKGGHFVNMQPHSLSERRLPFPLSSFFTESCGVELIQTCIFPPASYRRIDLGKLENGDCSLVRTSTTQRQLQGRDLYQPMKLFIALTCSWGGKLEGAASAKRFFSLHSRVED